MTRSSILFGSPKIACETACSMSMSKPSICPEIGLRAPSSRVSAETPAMSRPRSWILRHGGCRPASGPGPAGCRPGRRTAGSWRSRRRCRTAPATGPVRRWRDGDGAALGGGDSGVGVVVAGRRAGAEQPGSRPATASDGERSPLAAAHRYSSSRCETPHQAQQRRRSARPGARAHRPTGSQPPASSSCWRGLAAQRRPAARRSSSSKAANVALPESGAVPVASATAPSQSPPSSSARICCVHRGVVVPGQRARGRRTPGSARAR